MNDQAEEEFTLVWAKLCRIWDGQFTERAMREVYKIAHIAYTTGRTDGYFDAMRLTGKQLNERKPL